MSKVLFYPLLPDFRNQIDFEGPQASPVCPSGNSNLLMKTGMEHWWNDTGRGEWSIGGMILAGESGALVE